MIIKQLSVFIENREGRMEAITGVLRDNDINILSLSLADTSEYGILRLIVSDDEKARQVLRDAGFSARLTDVLAVRANDRVGFLNDLLVKLGRLQTSIEYMYTLPSPEGSVIIMKVAKPEETEALLEGLE